MVLRWKKIDRLPWFDDTDEAKKYLDQGLYPSVIYKPSIEDPTICYVGGWKKPNRKRRWKGLVTGSY